MLVLLFSNLSVISYNIYMRRPWPKVYRIPFAFRILNKISFLGFSSLSLVYIHFFSASIAPLISKYRLAVFLPSVEWLLKKSAGHSTELSVLQLNKCPLQWSNEHKNKILFFSSLLNFYYKKWQKVKMVRKFGYLIFLEAMDFITAPPQPIALVRTA